MRTRLLAAALLALALTGAVFLAWPRTQVVEGLDMQEPDSRSGSLARPAALADSGGERPEPLSRDTAFLQEERIHLPADGALESRADEASSIRVHARLVDPEGTPISGGELRLSGSGVRSESAADGQVPLLLDEAADSSTGATADEVLVFHASATGHAPTSIRHRNTFESEIWLGDIVLVPAARLRGRVLDEHGTPVDGATVVASADLVGTNEGWRHHARRVGPSFLTRGQPALAALERRPSHSALTDSSGMFEILDFAAPWATLFARKGDSLWTLQSPVASGSEELELRLAPENPATWIRGQVIDTGGTGQPGVELTLGDQEGNSMSGTTDPAGRFEFWVPAESVWTVHAYASSWELDHTTVENLHAGTHDAQIVLQDSEWFWVHVTDRRGEPITEGQVKGLSATHYEASKGELQWPLGRVVSDLWGDGRARMHLSEEAFYLRVQAPGYETLFEGPFGADHREDIELQLDSSPSIRGVVTADGKPLEGATVTTHRLAPEGQEYGYGWWTGEGSSFTQDVDRLPLASTTSNSDGEFLLPASSSGEDAARILVRAQHPALASSTLGPRQEREFVNSQSLELALDGGGSLSGRVECNVAAGLQGWTVVAASKSGEHHVRQIRPDRSFHFEQLQPGGWQLRAFRPGEQFAATPALQERSGSRADVVIEAGRESRFTLELELEESATLLGVLVVKDREPEPWNGRVWRESGEAVEFATDEAGKFEVVLPAPGAWHLELNATDSELANLRLQDQVELPPGVSHWQHELRLGTITARVRDADDLYRGLRDHVAMNVRHLSSTELIVTMHVWPDPDGELRSWPFPAGPLEVVSLRFASKVGTGPPIPTQEYELREGEDLLLLYPE